MWGDLAHRILALITTCIPLGDIATKSFTGMSLHEHLGLQPTGVVENIITRIEYIVAGLGMMYIGCRIIKDNWENCKYWYNEMQKYK